MAHVGLELCAAVLYWKKLLLPVHGPGDGENPAYAGGALGSIRLEDELLVGSGKGKRVAVFEVSLGFVEGGNEIWRPEEQVPR